MSDFDPKGPTTVDTAVQHEVLTRYLMARGTRRDVAEEAAAEAITRLWLRTRDGFRPRSPTAYLRRIGDHLVVDHARVAARDTMRQRSLELRQGMIETGRADPGAAIALGLTLQQACSRLAVRYQQVLTCVVDLDLSHAEAAQVLGLHGAAAVDVLLCRARKALAEALGDAD